MTASNVNESVVIDKLAIQELCVRYCWAVDTADIDSLMSLFVDDNPVYDDSAVGFTRNVGTEAVRIYFADNLFKQLKTMVHLTTNFLVDEINDNDAKGRCAAYVRAVAQDGTQIEVLCWYEDIYRRTPSGWKFASRTPHPWTASNLDAISD